MALCHTAHEAEENMPLPVLTSNCLLGFRLQFVYSMAIDTILLCFCEDTAKNDGSQERPFYMSPNLKKFVKSQKGGGGGGGDTKKP